MHLSCTFDGCEQKKLKLSTRTCNSYFPVHHWKQRCMTMYCVSSGFVREMHKTTCPSSSSYAAYFFANAYITYVHYIHSSSVWPRIEGGRMVFCYEPDVGKTIISLFAMEYRCLFCTMESKSTSISCVEAW